MARSYLCRAKMLLLLLIPCLHWQSGREIEKQRANARGYGEGRSEYALWDGCYYCHCHFYCWWRCRCRRHHCFCFCCYFPCCCCSLLLLLLLCSIFTACVCSSAKCSFHRRAQRWVGVRFFPYINSTTTTTTTTKATTTHFASVIFPYRLPISHSRENERAREGTTKKFQFEKRKWIWFDTVNASQAHSRCQ